MTADVTMTALVRAWPALAANAGPEWPHLYWQWLDCLRAYLAAADDDARAHAADDALAVMADAPDEVRLALKEELRRQYADRDGDRSRTGPEGPQLGRDFLADVQRLVSRVSSPPAVVRHTDVHCPTRVPVGKRFAIIVGLTRSPAGDAQDPQELQAEVNKLIKVVLSPRKPLETINDATQSLRIEPDQDSRPAVFYLRAREAGPQHVLLDFYDSRTLLVSQSLYLEALSGEVTEIPQETAPRALNIGNYLAPHPDLILRVTTQGNRLTYHLHFGDLESLGTDTIEGPMLRIDPRGFRHRTMQEISDLRNRLDVQGDVLSSDEAIRGIERIGQRLYRELFPEALRRRYCQFRDSAKTLLIISDEPWIPWELVKPYELEDFNGQAFEDDFLCMQFDLSRWVMPGTAAASEISVDSLACIIPTDSQLPATATERTYMRWLAQDSGAVDASPPRSDRPAVIRLLEGEAPVGIWHFACHGNYHDDDPDNSPLHLQDRTTLYPNDLVGPAVERRLSTDRPLVFLNACRVGALGLSLTGLAGWAKMLVGSCHVGALIAPLWEVGDQSSQAFAEAFYNLSRQPGCTLAQAVRQARQAVRERHPSNPIWLAYSLYAHPNARLKWPKSRRGP